MPSNDLGFLHHLRNVGSHLNRSTETHDMLQPPNNPTVTRFICDQEEQKCIPKTGNNLDNHSNSQHFSTKEYCLQVCGITDTPVASPNKVKDSGKKFFS